MGPVPDQTACKGDALKGFNCGVCCPKVVFPSKRKCQAAVCGALPDLLLTHGAVVEVEPDDVVLLELLDGAAAA